MIPIRLHPVLILMVNLFPVLMIPIKAIFILGWWRICPVMGKQEA